VQPHEKPSEQLIVVGVNLEIEPLRTNEAEAESRDQILRLPTSVLCLNLNDVLRNVHTSASGRLSLCSKDIILSFHEMEFVLIISSLTMSNG